MAPNSSFQPLNHSLAEVRAAIPPRSFERNTVSSLLYLFRDLIQVVLFAVAIYVCDHELSYFSDHSKAVQSFLSAIAWLTYWWFQGLAFTGVWVIGHECGHGAFSPRQSLSDGVGFVLHTLLWTPYFSWKVSHHRHHANHASMERDEVYVPKTRCDLGIPKESESDGVDYREYFEDTPIYTLTMLILQQLLAFPAYLLFNVSGQKEYPAWTNHFSPRSVLFRSTHFWDVIASDMGIGLMVFATFAMCKCFGTWNIVKYYGIPWVAVTHWFIMITYLHHTTPYIPHYRKDAWTYVRGAAATVDRDFLGWQGRWFLHDVAHFHVIHHFFPMIPWYNGEEATHYLKKVLGKSYLHSNEPVFRDLWRCYNDCQFVEDEGDIVFYRSKAGHFTVEDTKVNDKL